MGTTKVDKIDAWIERELDQEDEAVRLNRIDREIRTLTVSPARLGALEAVATAAKNLHLDHRVEVGEMWTHAYHGWELRKALQRLVDVESTENE